MTRSTTSDEAGSRESRSTGALAESPSLEPPRDVTGRREFTIFPIARVDVYASVVEQLKQLVACLEPGDRLPSERELSERFAVSRVPVREALRALESMGRIEIRRNAGSFVVDPVGNPITGHLRQLVPMDRAFLDHLVDVRAAIEDRVVAVTTQRAVDLGEVRSLLQRVRTEAEPTDRRQGSLDIRFEAALGRATGNPVLVELQRSVHELWVEAWSACGVAPGDQHQLRREHELIFEAVERRDVPAARDLMAQHVDRIITDALARGE